MSESKNLTKKELKKKSKKELIEMVLEYDVAMEYALDFKESVEEMLIADEDEKAINNVNTTNLDLALRMVGITFDDQIIDKIIDLVELIEIKGDDVTIKDICDLQAEWEGSEIDWNGLMNTSTT